MPKHQTRLAMIALRDDDRQPGSFTGSVAAFRADGGVFDVTSTGEVVVPITAKLRIGDATLFAVTVERPGGVVVSHRKHIVVTSGG